MKKSIILYILILFALNCSDEARTLNPEDLVTGTSTPTAPGYNYPYIIATAPADSGSNLPLNAQIFVFFNKPMNTATFTAANITVSVNLVPLSSPADYTITTASSYFIIGFTSTLPSGAAIVVNMNDNLTDSDGYTINYTTGVDAQLNFTAGISTDTTVPNVTAASNTPTGGAESLTGLSISIDFDEDLDPTTINSNTFYITKPGPVYIPVTYSYNPITYRATMTPQVTLEPSTTYTVTLTDAIAPIKDLAGNVINSGPLPHTWTFTTTATPIDPNPGAPSFVDSPELTLITSTSANISWSTDESTNFSLSFGRSDSTATTVTNTGLGRDPSSYHNIIFGTDTAALTAGKRYWVDVAFTDTVGNAGTGITDLEFNTTTSESPTIIHDGVNDQISFSAIENNWAVANSGFFGFWTNVNGANNEIYGELYNNSLTAQWSNPTPLFTGSSYTFTSASEDHLGGVLVLAINGSNLYAKRVTSAGNIYDWGVGTLASDTGYLIKATATNSKGCAVPVYEGIINSIITSDSAEFGSGGTTLVDSSGFFGVNVGDIVFNLTDNTITTVTTVVSGTQLTLAAGSMDNGDNYCIFNFAISSSDETNIISHGTATGGSATTIVDGGADFSSDGVSVGDVVYNFVTDQYAMVTAVTSATTLTLDNDAGFTGGGDHYCVTDRLGILYAWQQAGPTVHSKVITMLENTPVELVAEFTPGTNGQNPFITPNNSGSILVIYEETSGLPDKIHAALIDASGNETSNITIKTDNDGDERIVKVINDTNGGAVILFRTTNQDLYVQRIDSSGNRQWGFGARTIDNDNATTITSQQDMFYLSGSDDVIVVANVNNNIWARRLGATTWGPTTLISQATSIQQNPKIFSNGTDAIIAWEDDRFYSYSGYGIFGIKINATTGSKTTATAPVWRADDGSGTADYNGIALILNGNDFDPPTIDIVTYNNSNNALLIWEDHRTGGEGSNLVYYSLTTFAP